MDVARDTIGPLPALIAGSGPPLLFAGGLALETGIPPGSSEKMALKLIGPFLGVRRVHFVNRRPGLTPGMTMADFAAEHAAAIRAVADGPVDVMGLSTGGSIAQQLAADHPDVVRRLVLVSAACRLGPHGKSAQRRIAARIRRNAPRQAVAVAAASLVPPGPGQAVVGAAAWLATPLMTRHADLEGMAVTIDAEDAFDLAGCRSPIRAPTLILAGEHDRFYSADLFEETARLIPGSRLRRFAGRGHVTVTRHPEFEPEILRFLDA